MKSKERQENPLATMSPKNKYIKRVEKENDKKG